MGNNEGQASSFPLLSYYKKTRKSRVDATDSLNLEDTQFNNDYQVWRPFFSEAYAEFKQLWAIALPMIISGFLIFGKTAISVFFLGRLGKDELAAGSLASGLANISGYSILYGLAMGMEAISSQAYGANQWSLMGEVLQRTILILSFISIPITFIWLKAEFIFVNLGQDPYISSMASTYLAFSLPDLFLLSITNPLKIYLRTQGITHPIVLSSAIALAFHTLINYYSVYYLGLGIPGIAMSVVLTDFVILLVFLMYLWVTGIQQKSWQGWSRQCFNGWKSILWLAVPNCISVCLEWWWYELMIVSAGLLTGPAEAVATMGILIQATSFIYIFPSSLSAALSTQVGNELGAKRPAKAKASCQVGMFCAFVTSIFVATFMFLMRNVWGRAYTTDEVILSLTAAVMPVVGLCEFGNCPQTTGCGVLRGTAQPTLGAKINLGAFYGVGLPTAILLGFVFQMGLMGLWFGLLAAQGSCVIMMMGVLMRIDWEAEANRSQELTGANQPQNIIYEEAVLV